MKSIWELRHLWILLSLIVAGGAGLVVARSQMVPETFGDLSGRYGPYRAAALEQIAAKKSQFIADSVCHKCHQDVQQQRAEAKHIAVRCIHCHGKSQEHVAQAEQAARDKAAGKIPAATIAPAKQWDGDFLTKIDLYITEDRKVCLVCHEAVVGMPEDFQKINVSEHLEDNEAENPTSRETCFECHGGHDTEP